MRLLFARARKRLWLGADAPVDPLAIVKAALERAAADEPPDGPDGDDVVASLATRRAAIEKDLIHLEEDDLPTLAVTDPRRPAIVKARAAMIGELLALEDALLKSRPLHGRRWVDGLHISIENRVGSVRHWYNPHNDTAGETRMQQPYGYVRGTIGLDGDQVDVFLGPLATSETIRGTTVYVIHIRKAPDFREGDEQKCMIGFESAAAARACFQAHYDNPKFFGQMDALPWDEFKAHVRATKHGAHAVRGDVVAYAKATAPPSRRFLPMLLKGPMPPATSARGSGATLRFGGGAAAARREAPPPKATEITHGELGGAMAAAAPALASVLETLTKAFPGVPVAGRLRETASVAKRAGGGDDGVEDLASARLTLPSIPDEQAAVGRVKRLFQVRSEQDFLTRPREGLHYRGYHLVVAVQGQAVEIQLRTERQTRWADFVHDLTHRRNAGAEPPPEARAYLRAMADYYAAQDGDESAGDAGTPPEVPPIVRQQVGALETDA